MQSKITGGNTTPLFKARILNKYDVQYYRCNDTGFIQTEKVYWLSEAYSSAITNLDLGLVERNILLARKVIPLFAKYFKDAQRFLDYGGGYGMFVRMMRDRGYAFELYDAYCDNLFAANLQLSSLEGKKFDLITAFEVMEHLNNPLEEIAMLFSHTDHILFSTEIVPNGELPDASSWWYFSPSTGQHIALFTHKSLEYIAQHFSAYYYTDGGSLHLLTKQKFSKNPFVFVNKMQKIEDFYNRWRKKIMRWSGADVNRESLLGNDVNEEMKRERERWHNNKQMP